MGLIYGVSNKVSTRRKTPQDTNSYPSFVQMFLRVLRERRYHVQSLKCAAFWKPLMVLTIYCLMNLRQRLSRIANMVGLASKDQRISRVNLAIPPSGLV